MIEPVFEIKRGREFDLEEAKRVSRLLFRITQKKSQRVHHLVHLLEQADGGIESRYAALEDQVEQEIREWEGKVERLGGTPRGLWMADFDSGNGYFCWKFPEVEVNHWHGYQEGFSNRVRLSDDKANAPADFQEDASRLLNAQEMK